MVAPSFYSKICTVNRRDNVDRRIGGGGADLAVGWRLVMSRRMEARADGRRMGRSILERRMAAGADLAVGQINGHRAVPAARWGGARNGTIAVRSRGAPTAVGSRRIGDQRLSCHSGARSTRSPEWHDHRWIVDPTDPTVGRAPNINNILYMF